MEINVNVRLSAEPELARALETIADAVAAIRLAQCGQSEEPPKAEKKEEAVLKEAPKAEEEPKEEEPKDEPKTEEPKETESAPQVNHPVPKEDKKKPATKKKPAPKKEEEPKAEEEPKEEEAKQEELDTATDDGPAPTPEVTRDEVIALGKKLTKAGKKVAALLKDTYGVARFADITDDQLPEVYAKFKEMDE